MSTSSFFAFNTDLRLGQVTQGSKHLGQVSGQSSRQGLEDHQSLFEAAKQMASGYQRPGKRKLLLDTEKVETYNVYKNHGQNPHLVQWKAVDTVNL